MTRKFGWQPVFAAALVCGPAIGPAALGFTLWASGVHDKFASQLVISQRRIRSSVSFVKEQIDSRHLKRQAKSKLSLKATDGAGVESGVPIHTYAVPTPRFSRSALLQCTELTVVVGPHSHRDFENYVAGFFEDPPSSDLALEGYLVSKPGVSAGMDITSDVDFTVLNPVGPWHEQAGFVPPLKHVQLRHDPSVENGQQVLICDGLTLPASASDAANVEGQVQGLDLFVDTANAYHWMRFGGYLKWARYITDVVNKEASHEGSAFVDLGGGCGWMSALLKANLKQDTKMICTDIAQEALQQARGNFQNNQLEVLAEQGDLFEPVERQGKPWPKFVFFNPPQSAGAGAETHWRGSPDVALLTPSADATHFHARFCREALLAHDGVAWLASDWDLLAKVVQICCEQGWDVSFPKPLRDITDAPSALLELRRQPTATGASAECVPRAMAQVKLAAEYQIRAIGAFTDEEQAASYHAAALRGLPAGQTNYGTALVAGKGVMKDEAAAAKWLRRAANAGEIAAQVNLGMLLSEGGVGVPKNISESVAWFRKAAERGDHKAQTILARWFLEGHSAVLQDAQMPRWIRKVAELGDPDIQTLFAKMHLTGEGVPQSNIRAAVWLRRAAGARGGTEAKALLEAAAALEA